MRKIKFRGKVIGCEHCVNIGDLIIGDLSHFDGNPYITIPHDGSLAWCGEVDEETIGQFTGFTDKNGKEIYEGDLIKESWQTQSNTVIFFDGCFGFRCHNQFHLLATFHDVVEVVGNIFEV